MANRPIFIAESGGKNSVRVQSVEFRWHAGMAMSRRQMSMRSLHQAAQSLHPKARILEVSRMSDNPLGEQLSAFNLTLNYAMQALEVPVECAFQSSKVFERGGPFLDLLKVSPVDAKRDPRLQQSGRLTGFHFDGEAWPNEPLTAFYDWLYINALSGKKRLADEVLQYDIFTDIAFNPGKSINCQAGAVALFVALVRRGEFDAALSSREAFLKVESNATVHEDGQRVQGSLF
ncbi:MAG: hypothetical protein P8M68_05935 [Aquiluna sp.]|nr:hypothetical protein [Aquiluna sp.]